MKLYLSSYRIPNLQKFTLFVGKKPDDITLGIIFNAYDSKSPQDYKERYDDATAYFKGLGFRFIDIDLRDYYGSKPADLQKALAKVDVIWANGGNTYCLRYAMRKSGFDEILRDVLDGGVVYAGDSAGAIVAGPTLQYLEDADDPNDAPEVFYEGLRLTEAAVVPHWDSEKYHNIVAGVRDKLEADGVRTMPLKDAEAVCIEDGVIQP